MQSVYVQDDKGTWHLWSRVGGQVDCGWAVANTWKVYRVVEPDPGHYCTKCFNGSKIEEVAKHIVSLHNESIGKVNHPVRDECRGGEIQNG